MIQKIDNSSFVILFHLGYNDTVNKGGVEHA